MTNNTTTYTAADAQAVGKAFVTATNTYGRTAEFLRYVFASEAIELLDVAGQPAFDIKDKAKRKRALDALKVACHRVKNDDGTKRLSFTVTESAISGTIADIKKKADPAPVNTAGEHASADADDGDAQPAAAPAVGPVSEAVLALLRTKGASDELLAQVEAVLRG